VKAINTNELTKKPIIATTPIGVINSSLKGGTSLSGFLCLAGSSSKSSSISSSLSFLILIFYLLFYLAASFFYLSMYIFLNSSLWSLSHFSLYIWSSKKSVSARDPSTRSRAFTNGLSLSVFSNSTTKLPSYIALLMGLLLKKNPFYLYSNSKYSSWAENLPALSTISKFFTTT